MVDTIMRHAAAKDTWKDMSKLKWIGDKTTTHYTAKIDTLHRIFPDARFLCMVRDGRDVVVSDHFMRLRDKDFNAYPGTGRKKLAGRLRSTTRGVGGVGGGGGGGLDCPFFTQNTLGMLMDNWVRSIKGGLRAHDLYGTGSYQIKYEELVADPKRLGGLLEFLGVDSSPGMVDWIIDTCRFERFAEGRKRGEADPKSEFRKGIVGDWSNYFTERDKEQFKGSEAGRLLIELGYEKDDAW